MKRCSALLAALALLARLLVAVVVAVMAVALLGACRDKGPDEPSVRSERTTTTAQASLSPKEGRWLARVGRFEAALIRSLEALSGISGGWKPPNVRLNFDPRVFDLGSTEHGVLVTAALPGMLDCREKLRKVGPAPSDRTAPVLAHMETACRQFGLGASFITTPVLNADSNRDVPRADLEAAEQSLDAGFSALAKANVAARRALSR